MDMQASWLEVDAADAPSTSEPEPRPHPLAAPPPASRIFYVSEDIDDDFVLISSNELP